MALNTFSFTYDFDGIPLDVEVEYYKGDSGNIDRFNPENASPESGPEIHDLVATDANGNEFDISNITDLSTLNEILEKEFYERVE